MMDANGTKFHLLIGERDWGRATPGAREWAARTTREIGTLAELVHDAELTGLRWDSERNELTLAAQLFQFAASARDRKPGLSDRRGAGRDRYGNWYWIAEDEKEILVNSAGSRTTTHFWSAGMDSKACEADSAFGEFAPVAPAAGKPGLRFRGLAVTEDHYLVVGVLEPAGLLIFDLHAGGGPVQMLWPEEIQFTPFDFAARPGGGVVILDRDPDDGFKETRYWALDRHFNVQTRNQPEIELNAGLHDLFQPVSGEPRKRPARMFPKGITLDSGSPVAALDAISIEALPDDTVLILDRDDGKGFSQIYHFGSEGQLGEAISTDIMRALIPAAQRTRFTLVAHDFAFVAEHQSGDRTVPDRLYIVEQNGNQSYAFDVAVTDGALKLKALQPYLPMRLFGGKGLVSGGEQAWYDFADRWIPLVEQPRPRFATEATLETPEFDGGEPDCRWHRLMIDGCISAESKVEVWTRAANDSRDLPFTEWRKEPGLYRRGDGSELPYASIKRPAAVSTAAEYATWELLFQHARGRFIQIKLRLSGNGRTTPRLRALRAYYPRFSYLDHYLPAIYREDEQSAFFLDRFLANVEGIFTSIEDKIAAVQMLFDFRSVPGEYLDWLGGWFGIVLDPSWGDLKRRLFIKHAMGFFQYRGTIHGLKTALRLAIEDCADENVFDPARSSDPRRDSIRIIETYRARRTPGAVLGDPTTIGPVSGAGLPRVARVSRWQPAGGRSDLDSRYSVYLSSRFAVQLPAVASFPLRSYDWQNLKSRPGDAPALTPVAGPNDELLWRGFLQKRYSTVLALNLAHGTSLTTFDAVTIPASLLPASVSLADWNDFIAEKSAAWSDFAQEALGFVPRSLGQSRTRWRDFLASRYPNIEALNDSYFSAYDGFDSVPLPGNAPAAGAPRDDWDEFQQATAGTAGAAMRSRWQNFLARRYRRISALNQAYDTAWRGFDDVSIPDELPLREAALTDWHQFESVVLAIEAAAHRFTVLLPAPKKRTPIEFQHRRELATRIVNWEKPAHTVFDVRFYWAMFRVGAARLDYDTLIDVGSRAPELLSPMVLGQGYLAEAYLADDRDLTGRQVLGRDPLEERRRSGEVV